MSPQDHSPEILDEAYQRLHRCGPEFEEWLSNHGPMTVEALARHHHSARIHRWLDDYESVLEESPRASQLITESNWQQALGDPRRLADWPLWFENELSDNDWTDVLARWWPRLLPGVAASATHGVIRVGHAVRTLRNLGPNAQRLTELAQALGYWAARWQEVPGVIAPAGRFDSGTALTKLPQIPDPSGGIRQRLAQLDDFDGWSQALASRQPLQTVDAATSYVQDVVTAAVRRYHTHGHGSPVMLVHAATAPNAILRVIPSLPREQWTLSAHTAWTASAAIMAIYAPTTPAPATTLPNADDSPDSIFDQAADNGDSHVIKFADTALDAHEWSGDRVHLNAAKRCATLIAAEE